MSRKNKITKIRSTCILVLHFDCSWQYLWDVKVICGQLGLKKKLSSSHNRKQRCFVCLLALICCLDYSNCCLHLVFYDADLASELIIWELALMTDPSVLTPASHSNFGNGLDLNLSLSLPFLSSKLTRFLKQHTFIENKGK